MPHVLVSHHASHTDTLPHTQISQHVIGGPHKASDETMNDEQNLIFGAQRVINFISYCYINAHFGNFTQGDLQQRIIRCDFNTN